MTKKKTKSHAFAIFYLSFIIALCLVNILGLSFVDDFLRDYESVQPYKVVEKYITKLSAGDYSYTIFISDFTPTEFADTEDLFSVLSLRYQNKDITYVESSSHIDTKHVRYNLYNNETRLGYIILTETENKSKYGFNTWKIETCEPVEFIGTYTVTVPYGYTLYANEKLIENKYISEITTVTNFDLADETAIPKTVTYELSGFLTEPKFTVKSVNNENYTKTIDETNHIIFKRKSTHYDEIHNFTQKAMKAYTEVISLKADTDAYLKYVADNSNYADIIKNFNKQWIMYQPEFETTSVENFKMLNYAEYTDTMVSAEVYFEYTVKTKQLTEIFPSKYKICYIFENNEWKILNMVNI